MSQTKTQLIDGIVVDAIGNVNIDSNTFYVDAANNRVGLGTSSPSGPIHVTASSNGYISHTFSNTSNGSSAVNRIQIGNDASDGSGQIVLYGSQHTTLANILDITNANNAAMRLLTNNTERMRITSGGLVGIGTTGPVSTLNVLVPDSGAITISNTNDGHTGALQFGDTSSNSSGRISYDHSSNSMRFETAGTERARIDTSGRLLVGTSTAFSGERLNVVRTDATGLVLNLYSSASTSTTKIANSLLRVSSNASNADTSINFTDNTSNNYYFGGNNGGAYVMSNSAGVRLSNGGTSWASDSDERLKDIIEPIENGLDKVATLRTVIGKYKTDDEDRRRSFLIAQDVQAVLPEAVFDEQGTLMLAYTETIPLLVAALKESKERIESLEAKVAALEAV